MVGIAGRSEDPNQPTITGSPEEIDIWVPDPLQGLSPVNSPAKGDRGRFILKLRKETYHTFDVINREFLVDCSHRND